jgi:LAO/AO transport system kinase
MQRHATVELAERLRGGDQRALARAITLAENRDPGADELIRALYPRTGGAHVVGVTGPPGAGKSTLIGALIGQARHARETVGVLSIDPSSPVSQGALLGDRIRMSEHFLDPDVFIRSMASRGRRGGLADATLQALLLLDAAGKQLIFLETVGAGQAEVDVADVADTVLLVLAPGFGDSIQALKAGILEVPDLIALNKMDQPAAETMLGELRSMLARDGEQGWSPPIVATEAAAGTNVSELWQQIGRHRLHLSAEGRLAQRRRRNLRRQLLAAVTARVTQCVERPLAGDSELQHVLDRVLRRELDPLTAARALVDRVFSPSPLR